MKKEFKERGTYIQCRSCGLVYIDNLDWIMENLRTECPKCKLVLVLDE